MALLRFMDFRTFVKLAGFQRRNAIKRIKPATDKRLRLILTMQSFSIR